VVDDPKMPEACPKCDSEEYDYIRYERGREGDNPFFRCYHCEHEWKEIP
jgi:DNA-directed RNA polymerase subunit M/transcription elongation factor TFIIS